MFHCVLAIIFSTANIHYKDICILLIFLIFSFQFKQFTDFRWLFWNSFCVLLTYILPVLKSKTLRMWNLYEYTVSLQSDNSLRLWKYNLHYFYSIFFQCWKGGGEKMMCVWWGSSGVYFRYYCNDNDAFISFTIYIISFYLWVSWLSFWLVGSDPKFPSPNV